LIRLNGEPFWQLISWMMIYTSQIAGFSYHMRDLCVRLFEFDSALINFDRSMVECNKTFINFSDQIDEFSSTSGELFNQSA
jgi:hypothetical protein